MAKLMKPMRDLLLVELEKEERKTSGGLILTGETTENDTMVATVLAVGEGVVNEKTGVVTPVDVAVGDKIYIHRKVGLVMSEDKEEPIVKLILEEDVLAIVEEE